jgi:hypothetical protein
MAAPAIWQAAVGQQLDVNSALTRFLLAVPVAVLMVAGIRLLTADYRRQAAADRPPAGDDLGATAGGAAAGTDRSAEPVLATH